LVPGFISHDTFQTTFQRILQRHKVGFAAAISTGAVQYDAFGVLAQSAIRRVAFYALEENLDKN
jgi:hypothetical protein